MPHTAAMAATTPHPRAMPSLNLAIVSQLSKATVGAFVVLLRVRVPLLARVYFLMTHAVPDQTTSEIYEVLPGVISVGVTDQCAEVAAARVG